MAYEFESNLEQRRMMYITSLLNETLPNNMLTDQLLEEMSFNKNHAFGVIHMMLGTELQNAIESKETHAVADWKAEIRQAILSAFQLDWIHSTCYLNLAPYTRTIVYSFDASRLEDLRPHITAWFRVVNAYLKAQEGGELIAFANPSLTAFTDIGKLYKELRKLQDYRFVIGMGNLVFFDDFTINDDYSVSEYKYLHRYESLLNDEDYPGMLALTTEFRRYIMSHMVKDSKVTYVYKEMLAMTIRFLYAHETDHLKTIELLNNTITNFDHRFNDLSEVADFVNDLIHQLENQAAISEMTHHPHIRRVLKVIEEDYGKDLTLDAIAGGMNLSSAHLSRLFKEEIGITYKQYLTTYRLEKIKDLLRNTDQSITTIATKTGYQTANQLTRIFKKYEQITPRDYRQQTL